MSSKNKTCDVLRKKPKCNFVKNQIGNSDSMSYLKFDLRRFREYCTIN